MSIEQARERAVEIRKRRNDGHDPADERQQRREEFTFGEFVDQYFELHANLNKAERSIGEDRGIIRRYIPKTWNARRLSTLQKPEIVRLKFEVAKYGRYSANQTIRLLRSMFNLAKQWGFWRGGDNPATGIELFKETKRERYLNEEESRRFIAALREEPDIYWKTYFLTLFALGSRRSEVLSARWKDIDFDSLCITFPKTKDGSPHTLPLPGLFAEQERLTGPERAECGGRARLPEVHLVELFLSAEGIEPIAVSDRNECR